MLQEITCLIYEEVHIEYYMQKEHTFVSESPCEFLQLSFQLSLGWTHSEPVTRTPRGRVTARFVTRFNLWLRHDLWPQNASICDPARFVTKSASICDQRYTMILESKLCRGKLVFVFTLIMNATWYNMMHIYIYELCYNTYINSGARSLMLFYTNTIWISFCHIHIISHICVSCSMRHS